MSNDIRNEISYLPKISVDENPISFTYKNNNVKDKNKNMINVLYTRKMNEKEMSKGDISKLIYNSLNDPDCYFSEQYPVYVGSKIKLKKNKFIIF